MLSSTPRYARLVVNESNANQASRNHKRRGCHMRREVALAKNVPKYTPPQPSDTAHHRTTIHKSLGSITRSRVNLIVHEPLGRPAGTQEEPESHTTELLFASNARTSTSATFLQLEQELQLFTSAILLGIPSAAPRMHTDHAGTDEYRLLPSDIPKLTCKYRLLPSDIPRPPKLPGITE